MPTLTEIGMHYPHPP